MKLKLAGSFARSYWSNVVDENGRKVGQMYKRDRSGWKGGPLYTFYPEVEGLEHFTAGTVRAALKGASNREGTGNDTQRS